jgi:hypothetical protein
MAAVTLEAMKHTNKQPVPYTLLLQTWTASQSAFDLMMASRARA